MLNSQRWFNGPIQYQITVPDGWYTVLLYFSENIIGSRPAAGRNWLSGLRAHL